MLALFSYLRDIPILSAQYSSNFSAVQSTIFSLLQMSNALIRCNRPVFLMLNWYIANLLIIDPSHWILASQTRFHNFFSLCWWANFDRKQTHLVNLDSFGSFFELIQSILCLIVINSFEIIFLSFSFYPHTLYSCVTARYEVWSLSLLWVSDDIFWIVKAQKMLTNNSLSVFISLASERITDRV